jgi:hypothetical protein
MPIKSLKRRSAVVLALATAGALAVAGVAMGSGNSTVTVNFTPSNLPTASYQSGLLNVHTHTAYTNPGNANPGGATQRAQLYFDDDFRINTGAAPKCPTASLQGNLTMAQAMAACGPSRISNGTNSTAQASANGAFFVNGCVLIFNGQGTNAEVLLFTRVNVASPPDNNITCANPSSNTQGNTSILLKGDLKANPSSVGGDFTDPNNCSGTARKGCQLDVNNITATAALPLTDFNAYVKKNNYIQARCHDTGEPSASRLDLKVKFTYNNNTTQTKNTAADCT